MSAPWPRNPDPVFDVPPSPRTSTAQDELQHMLDPTGPPSDTAFGSQDVQSLRSNPSRSLSANFVSSPLNPTTAVSSPFARSRPGSRGSMYINRLASEDSQALAPSHFSSLGSASQRGSMVLYRLASDETGVLVPPKFNRDSIVSSSGDSIMSLSLNSDSKYPSRLLGHARGIVPYAYDPAEDLNEPIDEEDLLHDPGSKELQTGYASWRGFLNIGVLLLLTSGLLCLFVFYPVLSYFRDNARNLAIDGNLRINSTGQAPALLQLPDLIDRDTPDSVKSRKGFDGEDYVLVFSDEFNTEFRSFDAGDDGYWEAADLWYGNTGDLEYYDPKQLTTRNGSLVITMESVSDPTTNHGLQYRSGMLQSWNKFCFTSGYIEVNLSLPGPNSNTQGYWPGVWTMGNLGRPGYTASTEGMWPYSYNSCDVGTFPNQTWFNQTGPAAALSSTASRAKYNYALSWLPGQKLSACTCPGEDHPGPTNTQGRGAPEIDVLEAEMNKQAGVGQVVSQSAQFAPFSAGYTYDPTQFIIYNSQTTIPNPYVGSAVQQAVSSLTQTPDDIFQGSGQQFTTFGFEYWAEPTDPGAGFITWQTAGAPTAKLGAGAMGPDQATGVSQRLVSEEPMSIILNLGISPNWQTINLASMEFPAVMLIDYVRVYQRQGSINIGCDPPDYPTAAYINAHLSDYTNPNLTAWDSTWPKNGLYEGGC